MITRLANALRSTAILVPLLLGGAGILAVLYAWQLPPFAGTAVTTENAYIRGQVTLIAPQLSGTVADVPVQDYQTVKKGDLLVRIDDRIYRQKLAQAEAALEGARANLAALEQKRRSAEAHSAAADIAVTSATVALKNAESTAARSARLQERGVTSQSAVEQTSSAVEQARAAVAEARSNAEVARQEIEGVGSSRASLEAAVHSAEAAVELARIDLANTRIVAPADGRVGEIGAKAGQYVQPGSQLLALVPERIWVTANIKETQLSGITLDQPVSFTVDALKGARFTGRVASLSPATGSEFAVLKADNATGNFTKVAQRLPLKIEIDPGQPDLRRLAPGMSVVVRLERTAS